ncbi:hypothetical protein BDN72DRAFT_847701 [Pluteus cervinus]|uniref:Uncharacterized protein n=1 Tax=Pluteus cervinus TaxID=181527 RepID=A0ACD3ACF0_9AGAR|nr:hypothetical protein BDN72DRAFT_847701 [Pluteus cervinus]
MESPTQFETDQIIYEGTIDPDVEEDHLESFLDELDNASRDSEGESGPRVPRTSLYVRILEDVINQVYQNEQHLLTRSEWEALGKLRSLSYEARYCFARLILRKEGRWHPLDSMKKFESEVGENGLPPALGALCAPWRTPEGTPTPPQSLVKKEPEPEPLTSSPKPEVQVKEEEADIIDLTWDSDGIVPFPPPSPAKPPPRPTQQVNAVAGPSTVKKEEYLDLDQKIYDTSDLELDYICQDEKSMCMKELLERLNVEPLKRLAKMTKVKQNQRKEFLISALMTNASSQGVLNFGPPKASTSKGKAKGDGPRQAQLPFKSPAPKNGKSKDDGLRQAQLPFKATTPRPQQSQTSRLRELALKELGKCVKVNPDYHKLIRRLHIIYYRCTDFPTFLLLPSLLTQFKKRNYPAYTHKRDGTIWQTRAEYMEYEAALELEAEIEKRDQELAKVGRNTPGPRQLMTPVTPGPRQRTSTPHSASKNGSVCDTEVPEDTNAHILRAKAIKCSLDGGVYEKWLALVDIQREEGIRQRTPGLERFECGHVYTRMVHRALQSLARLKEFSQEADVIEQLLGQKFWRRGRRGKWYERRAILQTTHLPKEEGYARKKAKDNPMLRVALEGLKEALLDEDTGLVSRPGLVQRLVKLEKRLGIPEAERTECTGVLRKPTEVLVEAKRVYDNLKLDGNGRPIKEKGISDYFRRPGQDPDEVAGFAQSRSDAKATREGNKSRGNKSVWVGMDGEHVNVETRALQYYEMLGFKGFHSETRILTTLFALLFWDVLYTTIPGAFETPYQTAPLDLAQDCFYLARKVLIDARLEEIKAGRAKEILERHDTEYRPKKSWGVGVKWELCEREDLVEIVECIGGDALAIICRLFCEDYGGRSSGVPDLIVWKVEEKICKFVEVKGPGDTAQENQKLWFHSLLGAGTNVELCKVYNQGDPPPTSGTSNTTKRKRARKTPLKQEAKPVVPAEEWDEDEDEDEQVDQLQDDDDWLPQAKRQHLGQKGMDSGEAYDDDREPLIDATLKRKRPIDAVYGVGSEGTGTTPIRAQSTSASAVMNAHGYGTGGRDNLISSPATPPVSPTKVRRVGILEPIVPIPIQLQSVPPSAPASKRRKVAPAPISP